MKQLAAGFLLVIAIVLFGCKKMASSNLIIENASLNGKWMLTEALSDPGDGSGKWKTVDAPNALYLTLKIDSTVESNGLFGNGNYTIINGSTFEIYSSLNKTTFFYKIDGQTLTLSGGGCIEACGWKFKKLQ